MAYLWKKKNWFDFQYDEKALLEPLAQARLLQGKLLGQVVSLGMGLEEEAQAEILTEEVIKTAAIEGENLNKESVRSSVAMRLGLPHGVVSQDKKADGVVQVLLDAVTFYDKPLTKERMHGWHAALFPSSYSDLRYIAVGRFRESAMRVVSGPIGREKVHFEAVHHKDVEKEIKQFLHWWKDSYGKMDGILRAAYAHLYFVTIHPFDDGNGRIARALTDMALAQDEKLKMRFYSLSSQLMRVRQDYYNMLESVQNCRVTTNEWFVWFVKALQQAVIDSQGIISTVFARARFWNLHSRDQMNERQIKVVTKMLEAGKDGFLGGLTTRKYVSMTKASRATAGREITQLLEKGVLIKLSGQGRNVHYTINWPEVK